MKYIFIRDHQGAFSVDLMCRTLEVGSSGSLSNIDLDRGCLVLCFATSARVNDDISIPGVLFG